MSMNASERVVIFTRVTALPGKRDELAAAFADLHDAVALEPGCEMFIMHAAREEPDLLLFYEEFAVQAAPEAHQESDAGRAEPASCTWTRGAVGERARRGPSTPVACQHELSSTQTATPSAAARTAASPSDVTKL